MLLTFPKEIIKAHSSHLANCHVYFACNMISTIVFEADLKCTYQFFILSHIDIKMTVFTVVFEILTQMQMQLNIQREIEFFFSDNASSGIIS